MTKVTRREFLKASIVVGLAMGGAASLSGCSPIAAGTTSAANRLGGYQYESESNVGTWHHSACQRNCFDTCAIRSRVVEGRLVEVRGDASNPYTAGGLCVKTQSYVDWTYHKDRILYPLRRTGKKGPDCTFERISWEEAIDEITSKWKDIIDQYGGEAITWSRYQGNQGAINRRVLEPLFFRMGATFCEGSMCNNGYVFSLPYTTGTVPVMRTDDIANKNLYISWAHNPTATTLHTMKFIKAMNKKGGKIVVVNPISTPETMWADLVVNLRPGTDIPFAMGVAKYLIDNNMYDSEWIAQWGSGFEDYSKACSEWSAEKVAETCGIPAEQVEEFAKLLWDNRANACLKTGLCLGRRRNGGMSHISVKCLTGLVGHPEMYYNMTSSGGVDVAVAAMQKQMLKGTLPSEAQPVGTIRNWSSPDLGKVLTSQNFGPDHNFEDNPIRSIMIFGNNPMISNPNIGLVREGLSREDLFTVVHDMFMTPSCNYADIILPAPSNFEYEEFNGGYGQNYVAYNEKILEPMGECVANWELCNILGQAMGYTDPAFYRDEQWFRDAIMSKKKCTFEELAEKGWIDEDPETWEDAVYAKGFPTPTGKFQFASDELEHDHGTRTVKFTIDPESLSGDSELLSKYPLALLSPSAKEYLNGCFGNMEDNNYLFHEHYVYLDKSDAEARGIQEGDKVRVFNDRGEIIRIARVLDGRTAENTCYIIAQNWPNFTGEATANELTGDARADIGRGVTFQSCLVEVEKL